MGHSQVNVSASVTSELLSKIIKLIIVVYKIHLNNWSFSCVRFEPVRSFLFPCGYFALLPFLVSFCHCFSSFFNYLMSLCTCFAVIPFLSRLG